MKLQRLSERCRIETAAKMTANMQADSECVLALSKLIITFTLDGRPKLIWWDVARNGIMHLPSSMILAKARIG